MAGTRSNTRAAVADLLQEMRRHSHRMATMYRNDGDEVHADEYVVQALAYDTAAQLLTNPEYFETMRKIFIEEG